MNFFQNALFCNISKFKTTSRWLGFATKLCRPNSACICDTSQPRKLKTMTLKISWFMAHRRVTKSSKNTKIMELGFAPTMPGSIPFAPKLLPHYFGGICEDWVQPVFQNHEFRFTPHTPPSRKIKQKHQYHGTWLCTNHAKINSFCSQNSPTSLWRHLWGLSRASFPKPRFLFFTPHHQVTKSSQNTKIMFLAMHQACQD